MHKSAQMKQIKDHYKSLKVHTSELMEERNKLKQKFDDCVDIMYIGIDHPIGRASKGR
jgi:hypothetical protein